MPQQMLQHPPEQLDAKSVQLIARIAGVLYLIIIVIGVLGEAYVRGSLVVAGDATETARRIIASEGLWRLGIAGQLLLLICALGLTWCWYMLLRLVCRNLTWLAVFFALASLSVESVCALHLQEALDLVSGGSVLGMVAPETRHLMAYLAMAQHGHAFGIALAFFGVECLVIGYLIRQSGYFPGWGGILMQIAGLCYIINSFVRILSPSLAAVLFPAILLPPFIGESAFCLWLLIKGVDTRAWLAKTTFPQHLTQ